MFDYNFQIISQNCLLVPGLIIFWILYSHMQLVQSFFPLSMVHSLLYHLSKILSKSLFIFLSRDWHRSVSQEKCRNFFLSDEFCCISSSEQQPSIKSSWVFFPYVSFLADKNTLHHMAVQHLVDFSATAVRSSLYQKLMALE